MIYFTADTHFHHKSVIEYCNRPAKDVEEMNALLVERWNSKVGNQDEMYFLGDFAFCGTNKATTILDQLNGKKYWIRGNHDYNLAKKVGHYFEWIKDYHVLRIHDRYQSDSGEWTQYHQAIVLMHFPILSWENMQHGSWHLHGHCHGNLQDIGTTRLDIGVDTNNLYPYSYEEIRKIMVMRSVVPFDHHK